MPRSADSPSPDPAAALVLVSGLHPGQVLQRSARGGGSARLAGRTTATGAVRATVEDARGVVAGWRQRRVGSADGRRFAAVLAGLPAGGPYRLTLAIGAATTTVPEFYIGDVWLLAGQSNMEGVGNLTGAARPHRWVRAFSLRREWGQAVEPLHIPRESPDVCHHQGLPLPPGLAAEWRRTSVTGTGVGLYFGRELVRRTGVPQGLICTARGGTSLTQWNPDHRGRGGESLYASLLASVRATGQPVRGVLWYQGESDADAANAPLYTTRMQKLVRALRRDLRQPRLPWLMVQIGRVVSATYDARHWNSIQDQQERLPDKIRDLDVVAALDLPMDDFIHIGAAGYPRLARRLAWLAARLAYGDRTAAPAPRLRAVVRARDALPGAPARGALDVVLAPPGMPLRPAENPGGFTVISATGEPLPLVFHTTVHRDRVRLHLGQQPPAGAQVAYGHGLCPTCTLVDTRDLAIPAFRSLPLQQWASPFVTRWRVSTAPISGVRLSRARPAPLPSGAMKEYGPDGFINEHPAWLSTHGVAWFETTLRARRPIRVDALLGYDGPLRMWVNGRPVHADYQGKGPCFADQVAVPVRLRAGDNRIVVAVDVSVGRTWGFFLRFTPAGGSAAFSERWAETLRF